MRVYCIVNETIINGMLMGSLLVTVGGVIGLFGALIAAWNVQDEFAQRDVFTISYWIGGLATVSHAIAKYGLL